MRLLMIDQANDALSQMAEGWARALSVPSVEVYSAGRAPTHRRPEVVAVMREVGIDVSAQIATTANSVPRADLVVSLDDGPAPAAQREVRWVLDDPCQAPTGRDPLAPFRVARDALGARIAALLDAEALKTRFGGAVRDRFALADDMVFVDHASFGATPRSVLQAQQALREELEAQPVRFMHRVGARLRAAAGRVAALLKANPDGVAFVDNTTTGINTVLRSFDWQPGDVIVSTSQRHRGVSRSLQYLQDRFGARVHTIDVPLDLHGRDQVVQAVRDQWPEERPRLALFEHVSGTTGAVWPIEELVTIARERGTQTLIDGAQVPGQVPVDLTRLCADYWVGSCHKWFFAPKGCAVLYVARERRAGLHPLVISHGYGQGLTEEFDWVGTRDPTPWLAVEAAADFVSEMGGADRIRAHNVALRADGARILERVLGLEPVVPSAMLAAVEARPLPPLAVDPDDLSRQLWQQHRIEARFASHGEDLWVRISAQIYNTVSDYEKLAAALAVELER